MLDWLAFTARRPLYNTYAGYWVYTHILLNRGERNFGKIRMLKNGEYRFLLTGYPRSGNTYLTSMVRQVLQVEDFGHHMHTRLALKIALDTGLRVYVVFRSPMESVMSLILLNSNRAKNYVRFRWMESAYSLQYSLLLLYLREYIHYHEYVISKSNQIKLISSESAFSCTKDILACIASENRLNVSETDSDRLSRAREAFLDRKNDTKEDKLIAGAPNAQKEAAKQNLHEMVGDHPLMQSANNVFKRMEETSDHGRR